MLSAQVHNDFLWERNINVVQMLQPSNPLCKKHSWPLHQCLMRNRWRSTRTTDKSSFRAENSLSEMLMNNQGEHKQDDNLSKSWRTKKMYKQPDANSVLCCCCLLRLCPTQLPWLSGSFFFLSLKTSPLLSCAVNEQTRSFWTKKGNATYFLFNEQHACCLSWCKCALKAMIFSTSVPPAKDKQ